MTELIVMVAAIAIGAAVLAVVANLLAGDDPDAPRLPDEREGE